MKNLFLQFLLIFSYSSLAAANYPKHWWAPVQDKKPWEVTPDQAKPGEVILSKRNELGIFSNLGLAPFILDGTKYFSIEGLWQGMKFPDPELKNDPRNSLEGYPFNRNEVFALSGFPAMRAGKTAAKINLAGEVNFVSYRGHKFDYTDLTKGSEYHYQIIKKATWEKVRQNPQVKNLLLKTKGLKLRRDHLVTGVKPKSYKYHLILMEIRDQLLEKE